MTKSIAILQSNYIPWRGYFDLINSVDEFVLLDSVQYTKNDWRNRNRIKTPIGPSWLTIPVCTAGRPRQSIFEATIVNGTWARRHWRTLVQNYSGARYFKKHADALENAYNEASKETFLSSVNKRFLDLICQTLSIPTVMFYPMQSAVALSLEGGLDSGICDDKARRRVDRIIAICRSRGADRYLTGPRARGYLDVARMVSAGIDVLFSDYSGYAEYDQLYPPFNQNVSALDGMLNLDSDLITTSGIRFTR